MSNAPEWIAAVGTALATAGTTTLLGMQRRSNIRAQAIQVSAWLVRDSAADAGRLNVSLNVRNGSPEPVREVTVSLEKQGSRILELAEYRTLPPEKTLTEEKIVAWSPVVSHGANGPHVTFDTPRISIMFTDARGNRWRRGFDGTLKRLKTA
ncbi:MAG: hypothetical protein GEU71_17925 [Actinobacteria bacterium]|nr:hypothetical protein [Actinomycetota bacterium]